MTRKNITEGMPLSELAERVGGKLIGDPDRRVFGICPLEDPEPEFLAFTRRLSVKEISAAFGDRKIAGLICPDKRDLAGLEDQRGNFLLVPDPMAAITKLLPLFFDLPTVAPGISPRAEISPSARIGERVFVGAFAVIGDQAVIGDEAVIHPHVVIYPRAEIGARAVVHAGAVVREECIIGPDNVIQPGAVIGADGFGYVPDAELGLRPVPQVGNVVLAERVEIGANTCIDRATLGKTLIGIGTKIDNQVQIGHNVRIGRHSILCGKVAVAGSARIGSQVVLAGYVGVGDHITVGDGVRVGAKGGVSADLLEKGDFAGFPAVPAHRWRMVRAVEERLPEMRKELNLLLKEREEKKKP